MTTAEALVTRLEAVLESSCIWAADAQTMAFALHGCRPTVVARPETLAQAAEIVALAGRERLAVVPWGQGTQMHLGQAPRRYDLALSLAGLKRVTEYDSANLTVIAEAGVPLRHVYTLTVPERQFLPLGFPGTTASLGGLLVTNTSGVKRARYGGVRDLLLGVRVALADGAVVRYGGRVVKNVAGYDMNKLFVGSLGVFGVVLETTYRLAALPEDDRMLAVAFPTLSHATAAAAAIQGSPLLPSALTMLTAEAAAACPALQALPLQTPQVGLLVNFDGMHEAVERQVRDSRQLCQQHGGMGEVLLTDVNLLHVWEFQEAWRSAPAIAEQDRIQLRIGVLPSALATIIHRLTPVPAFSQSVQHWLVDYSSGQIFVHLPLSHPLSEDMSMAVQAWLHHLRAQVRDHHGYCVVEYASAPLRQQLDLWGVSPGQQLLKLYKQRFDPYAVLNPGRYVAGL
jgi:glycolate oxidase FAD binding subunit